MERIICFKSSTIPGHYHQLMPNWSKCCALALDVAADRKNSHARYQVKLCEVGIQYVVD